MGEHMKKPCKHCPFRSDVTPFLHPDRADEISCAASNPYSEFHCHTTTEYDEDGDDMVATGDSKICAGFLAMQINEAGIDAPDDFKFPSNVYSDSYEMVEAYMIEWDRKHKRRARRG